MPPAWSSFPERGLNFTSAKPSLMRSSVFAAQQNVASPDCLSTLGRDGAVSSATTSHLAAPLPVMPTSQPLGRPSEPSKVALLWAMAILSATNHTAIRTVHFIAFERQLTNCAHEPLLKIR